MPKAQLKIIAKHELNNNKLSIIEIPYTQTGEFGGVSDRCDKNNHIRDGIV
jgi:hypothetical protein